MKMIELKCECGRWDCRRKIELPLGVARDTIQQGLTIIVDGCGYGVSPRCRLVEQRKGYAIYEEIIKKVEEGNK